MNASRTAGIIGLLLIAAVAPTGAADSEFAGRWEVTTTYPGGTLVAGLELTAEGGRYSGRSGYLVPAFFPFYKYSGAREKDALQLKVLWPDGATPLGELQLKVKKGVLSGKGVLHQVPITVSGRRPLERPKAPKVIDFTPEVYYRTFSGAHPPALRIFPGDTVRTQTVDANGGGKNGPITLPGNPQTGPFYIEGAMIGDTIAVRFNRIRPNRDTAFQQRAGLMPKVLPSGYPQQPQENWSELWQLDRERGTAIPVSPSENLKDLKLELAPMLGCVAVAPYEGQAYSTADLGAFGGNLDYNQIREGVTVYLPVFQAGALLMIGDGHALQADGEITGQGLETSMDVEFTVDLMRNQLLEQPWLENDAYVMVSGIGGSLVDAQQLATAGLSNWLQAYYRLNGSEIATVFAGAIRYDIAELVSPHIHVVAKIPKRVLTQVPKPAAPASVFCQSWGCLIE